MEDITDTRKEINKPVYEANKPIYGSNNDDCDGCDDGCYDCDDDYNDDEDGMDDSDNVGDEGEEGTEGELVLLSVRNYVENKHDEGVNPTLKNIADLKVCRNNSVRCADVVDIVRSLGYDVEDNDDKIFSSLEVGLIKEKYCA